MPSRSQSHTITCNPFSLQDLPLSLQQVRVTRMAAASNNAGLFGGGNPNPSTLLGSLIFTFRALNLKR